MRYGPRACHLCCSVHGVTYYLGTYTVGMTVCRMEAVGKLLKVLGSKLNTESLYSSVPCSQYGTESWRVILANYII